MRIRYSLRMMFVATFAFAAFCGWYANRFRLDRNQAAAVAHLHRNGASVYYSYQYDAEGSVRSDASPSLLSRLILYPQARTVTANPLNGELRDDDLIHLHELNDLKLLDLSWPTSVTDTGLESLHEVHSLDGIVLCRGNLSEASIVRLKQALPNCQIKFPQPAKPEWSSEDDGLTVTTVFKITAELFGLDVSAVTSSTSTDDLALATHQIVELVGELNDHFNLSIPNNAITRLTGTDQWDDSDDALTMAELAKIVDQQQH